MFLQATRVARAPPGGLACPDKEEVDGSSPSRPTQRSSRFSAGCVHVWAGLLPLELPRVRARTDAVGVPAETSRAIACGVPAVVGGWRLICGRPSCQTPFPQVSPKREDLTQAVRYRRSAPSRARTPRPASRRHRPLTGRRRTRRSRRRPACGGGASRRVAAARRAGRRRAAQGSGCGARPRLPARQPTHRADERSSS
jgi:hypothetical protein